VAEILVETIDCAEQVRFALSGTDVVQLAIRLAKAYTKKGKIIKFEGHYHGWADNIYVSTWIPANQAGDRARPVPILHSQGQSPYVKKETIVLPWNDLNLLKDALERDGRDVACVIMEPAMCNNGGIWARPGYLEGVRELCSKHRVLLIFDEVITGFRFHPGGLQTLLKVTPDLTTLGKAVGGGFPLAALGGPAKIMSLIATGEVMHAGTFNGNPIGMAATLATLETLRENGGKVFQGMIHRGKRLMEGIREAAKKFKQQLLVNGRETAFHVHFTPKTELFEYRDLLANDWNKYNYFQKRLIDFGVRVIFRGNWYLSAAHTEEDISYTLEQVNRVLSEMAAK